jgi:hypothetical protein
LLKLLEIKQRWIEIGGAGGLVGKHELIIVVEGCRVEGCRVRFGSWLVDLGFWGLVLV